MSNKTTVLCPPKHTHDAILQNDIESLLGEYQEICMFTSSNEYNTLDGKAKKCRVSTDTDRDVSTYYLQALTPLVLLISERTYDLFGLARERWKRAMFCKYHSQLLPHTHTKYDYT